MVKRIPLLLFIGLAFWGCEDEPESDEIKDIAWIYDNAGGDGTIGGQPGNFSYTDGYQPIILREHWIELSEPVDSFYVVVHDSLPKKIAVTDFMPNYVAQMDSFYIQSINQYDSLRYNLSKNYIYLVNDLGNISKKNCPECYAIFIFDFQ
jgi:hypothetical protein